MSWRGIGVAAAVLGAAGFIAFAWVFGALLGEAVAEMRDLEASRP